MRPPPRDLSIPTHDLLTDPDGARVGSPVWVLCVVWPLQVNPGRVLKEQHYYSRPWINAAQWVFRYKRFASAIGGGARGDDVSVAGDATPDYIWANLRFLNTAYRKTPGTHGAAWRNQGSSALGGTSDITIAEVIAELNPKARLILSLRNPIDRLWSDFFYFAHRPNHERELPLYASRAVQFHPHGGQSDFAWLPARTPHVGPQYVW